MNMIKQESDRPNYPLRAHKGTIYEGGTKVPCFIHSPLLDKTGHRYSGLFHMVDFLPTLVNLASEGKENTDGVSGHIDGLDQWQSLVLDLKSPRTEIIYNIDDLFLPAF